MTTSSLPTASLRADERIRAEDSRAGEAEAKELRLMVIGGVLLIPAIWGAYYLISFLQG